MSIYQIKRMLVRFIYTHIIRDNVLCARRLGVRIGQRCRCLDEAGAVFGSEPWMIEVGDHVEITRGVRFLSHEGAVWCARELEPDLKDADIIKPTYVGNNVMIGINSLIMPGVRIGNNVIIGAHSVVTHDIPDNTVVAGGPAKPISTIDRFIESVKVSPYLVKTKEMTQQEKKDFLIKTHPEWFGK